MSQYQIKEQLHHDPVPPVAKVPYLVIWVFMSLNIYERIDYINTLYVQLKTYFDCLNKSPRWLTETTTQLNNYIVVDQTSVIFENLLQEYDNVRTGNFDTKSVENILQKFEEMKKQLYEMDPQIISDTLKTLFDMQTINLTQWTVNQMPLDYFKFISSEYKKIYLLFLCTNLLKYKYMHAIRCTEEFDKFYIFMKDTNEQAVKLKLLG